MRIERLDQVLESAKGCHPMQGVIEYYYSQHDIAQIEKSSPEQMAGWIADLNSFAAGEPRPIGREEAFPFLARGLTGYSVRVAARRDSRVAFWKKWNTSRCCIRTLIGSNMVKGA